MGDFYYVFTNEIMIVITKAARNSRISQKIRYRKSTVLRESNDALRVLLKVPPKVEAEYDISIRTLEHDMLPILILCG